MAAAYATLILLALFGHAALWIGLVNRTHSTGMPRWAVKWLSRICLAAVIVVPLVLAAETARVAAPSRGSPRTLRSLPPVLGAV